MFKEIIDFVTGLKRPETINTYDGEYIYHDNSQSYSKVFLTVEKREVCNVNSFSRATIEVARRAQNETGNKMTVIFDDSGALLFPEEHKLGKEQNKWHFERRYTRLWNTIRLLVGKNLSHKELLRKLESVKDCVNNFEDLYAILSKLKVSKKIDFTSQPMYEEGDKSGSFSWNQRVDSNGVNQTASCPSSISFEGRIVRGSETSYGFELSLTPVLNEEKGSIDFAIEMPGFDMVLDQVREDEYKTFCEDVKGLSELLILRDY